MTDRLASAIESLKSGTPIEVEDGVGSGGEGAAELASEPAGSEGGDVDGQETSTTESQEPASLDETVKPGQAAKQEEEIVVKGPDGKPTKLKVDWENKEQLKKYIHAAAGMRMFQAERDKIKQEYKALSDKHKDIEDSWGAVKKAYSEEGLKGLVNLLTNRPDGYDLFLQQELNKIQRRAEASPEELRQMDLEERLERESKERQKLEKQIQENLTRAEQQRLDAQKTEFLSRAETVFDKVRFAGKLGDEQAEDALDASIWSQTMSRLQAYPEDVEITSALLEKEFKQVASTYRKVINQQAEKKTNQVINQKRANAAEQAAAIASRGYKQNAEVDAFKQNIRSGNLTDALKSFVTGKVRL